MEGYKSNWREKICYGVGAIGLDLSYGLFYSYLSYYLSSVLGLKEGFLLLLTPLARIWDGINDPMMGTIVDNTKTKIGKYRPWIVIGAVSNAVVLTLLFTSFGMSGTKLYIYIAVMYVLWGMTNTMADIPYWSMVPSFTTDPSDRNLVATVARTFSGLGQGIITVLTPIILPKLSTGITTDKGYSAAGFSRWAGICAAALVIFAVICVASTKEKHIVYNKKEKFSLTKMFQVVAKNDQLVVFIVFAMLSNAGWYLTSGTAVYYFNDVLGKPTEQSMFSMIGAVGSVLGLLVIPIMSRFTSKQKIYQFSLILTIIGYALMYLFGPVLKITLALDFSYILASIGIGSMFVAQTIFLADIVDYGEYKNNERNESITFSMKGFLQKLAYTIQTIILFGGLKLMNYNQQITSSSQINESTKTAIGIIAFGVPPILMIISLIVFSAKFKIHGELADKIHNYIVEKRANEEQ
ncbi:MAG: glycoside-pentoside-hexuronide (GPH):cation symporter [Acetobacter sp.]|nr:glycoside-pentoside-hexuronide (GPH):cation symporter [Bacteroides sp.]MCM1341591.1 glycoside-pentoside-hexuronide (GPH):cation symporter [Acetobacter sp.]MCM1433668.1 glycoside-pentoside-hexuronide (GPH):cation symporter [Clostridiales bacterium]